MSLNFSIQTTCEQFFAFVSPQEEWEYRIEMIRSAKEYLYISTYYVDYHKYGERFLMELIKASGKGVKVWLLIDQFGQKMTDYVEPKEKVEKLYGLFEALTRSGANLKFYRTDYWIGRKTGAGHHFKFQVNESQTALISSGNISYRSYDQWNEFAFRLRGPVVYWMTRSFFSLFEGRDRFHEPEVHPETESKGSTPLSFLFCDPNFGSQKFHPLRFRGTNCISEKIIDLIQKAEKEILISSFYFKPVKSIQKALLVAASRGVAIKVFHSSRNALPETDLAWIASGVEYMRLLNHDISIYENQEGEHSKMLLFDDKIALWGSYNLEHQAHDRLAEGMLLTEDAQIIDTIRKFFIRIEANPSVLLVTKSYKRELSLLLRAKKVLFTPFKKWL